MFKKAYMAVIASIFLIGSSTGIAATTMHLSSTCGLDSDLFHVETDNGYFHFNSDNSVTMDIPTGTQITASVRPQKYCEVKCQNVQPSETFEPSGETVLNDKDICEQNCQDKFLSLGYQASQFTSGWVKAEEDGTIDMQCGGLGGF